VFIILLDTLGSRVKVYIHIFLQCVSSLILFPLFATSITSGKFTAGVVDTGGKFAAGVDDTKGKFTTGVVDTSGAP
jgi:hypothetical protein